MRDRARIEGNGGGFLVTTGRLRLATLNGRTYVVGRGKAREVADMRAGQALLAELLAASRTADASKRAAAVAKQEAVATAAITATGLAVGARVRFEIEPGGTKVEGRVEEVGARSIAISHERNLYRRSPSAVEALS